MIGYGIGFIGQGAAYVFASTYLVLFLTDGVGMSSSMAATISSLALFVEVVMGMLVGNLSDKCTSKMGRRRPFILFAALTMLPVLAALFYVIEAPKPMLFAYYLLLAVFFRISFACFEIPNGALGAEIVSGYDERTKLRTISRFFSVFGNGLAYIMPLIVLEIAGNNVKGGWLISGIIIGAASALSWVVAFIRSRGVGTVLEKSQVVKKTSHLGEIAKNYGELLKLKTTRILVVYKASFGCAFALFNVATIYYLQYSVGIGNRYSSYIYAINVAIFFIMVPLVSKMAIAMGKVKQQIINLFASGVIAVGVFFVGPSTIAGAIVFMVCFSVTQTSFWQLCYSIYYDVIEVDEYVNYKRREGDLMSLISVLGTLISAIMVECFGIVFELVGYDPQLAVQPESVVNFLNASFILIPGICLIIGAAALKAFPINKKTFESLQEVLRLRKEGEDYSQYMDDINKIIG